MHSQPKNCSNEIFHDSLHPVCKSNHPEWLVPSMIDFSEEHPSNHIISASILSHLWKHPWDA